MYNLIISICSILSKTFQETVLVVSYLYVKTKKCPIQNLTHDFLSETTSLSMRFLGRRDFNYFYIFFSLIMEYCIFVIMKAKKS